MVTKVPDTEIIDVVRCSPVPTMEFLLQGSPSPSDRTNDPNEKKYYCQRCLNHNQFYPRKGHKPSCQFNSCRCSKCDMVETRRKLNNELIKKRGVQTIRPVAGRRIRDPMCARCGAHNERVPLRGHKKSLCRYANCFCTLCKLVEDRRVLMARQIKLRRDQQKQREHNNPRSNHESSTTPGNENTSPTPPTPPHTNSPPPMAVLPPLPPPPPLVPVVQPIPVYPNLLYPNLSMASLIQQQQTFNFYTAPMMNALIAGQQQQQQQQPTSDFGQINREILLALCQNIGTQVIHN